MDIAAMARAAGLTVLLEGRIGRETYESISGSLEALRRFGDAYRAAAAVESAHIAAHVGATQE